MERNESSTSICRDHLFISYAWEDQPFARWLALRLTALGYKVWIDQLKLLGGESWPRDIDQAIKTRTFRMLGLLSKSSIAKPNPLKERTLALGIARQPGRKGFLIPLNVDGMSATDLDWLTSDLTFISFSSSWANGLAQLVKLLEREGCPKTEGDGRAIVSRVTATDDLIVPGKDRLISNAYPFAHVPSQIIAFRIEPALSIADQRDLQRDWSFYFVSPHRVLAFHSPPEEWRAWIRIEEAQQHDWRSIDEVDGIEPRNVINRLLRGCIETRLRKCGFVWSNAAFGLTFPGQNGATVRITLPSGKKTAIQHSGERTFFRVGQAKTRYRYRLAVQLTVEREFFSEYSLIWRLRFHLTDTDDQPLLESQRNSRHKHVTRSWHNHEWSSRYLAAIQLCRDLDGKIRIGPEGEEQVILDCTPMEFQVDRTIDEAKLEAPEEMSDDIPAEDDFDDDPISDEDQDHDE